MNARSVVNTDRVHPRETHLLKPTSHHPWSMKGFWGEGRQITFSSRAIQGNEEVQA